MFVIRDMMFATTRLAIRTQRLNVCKFVYIIKYVYSIERPDRLLFIINGQQTTFFTYDMIVTKQKHTKILQTK